MCALRSGVHCTSFFMHVTNHMVSRSLHSPKNRIVEKTSNSSFILHQHGSTRLTSNRTPVEAPTDRRLHRWMLRPPAELMTMPASRCEDPSVQNNNAITIVTYDSRALDQATNGPAIKRTASCIMMIPCHRLASKHSPQNITRQEETYRALFNAIQWNFVPETCASRCR